VRLAEAGGQPVDPLGLGSPGSSFATTARPLRQIPAQAGAVCDACDVHGLAAGDVDNDGDLDLVIVDVTSAPLLLDESVLPRHRLGRVAPAAGATARRDGGPSPACRTATPGAFTVTAATPRRATRACSSTWPAAPTSKLWMYLARRPSGAFPRPPLGAYATLRRGEGGLRKDDR
jgi:hypothetical protein